ncbi:hypothetical protein RFI_19941, partial [Reticulomyxa filosa]
MIVNLSPSSMQWEETHNSLKYADRAKSIRVDPKLNLRRNEDTSHLPQVVQSLRAELDQLKKQLVDAQQQNASPNPRLSMASMNTKDMSSHRLSVNINGNLVETSTNEMGRSIMGLSDDDWLILKDVQQWLTQKFNELKHYAHIKAEVMQQQTKLLSNAATLQ